jgi:SAM-dependent methyltransferase
MSCNAWSYDAIAEVYATDMGQSMPFDDVDWYRELCLAHAGTTLELGCGTGRILLPLLAAGVDAFGVDRSLPMLARLRSDARAHRLMARVAQMDLRSLCINGIFSVVLAPYSLITYLIEPAQAIAALAGLRKLLGKDGRLVLDAFVPQAVASFADFRKDYSRPHGVGTLDRYKRITANPDGSNRIERRYRLMDAMGALIDEFHTDETIRPYTDESMIAMAERAGLQWLSTAWDYGTRASATGARFASLVFIAENPRRA